MSDVHRLSEAARNKGLQLNGGRGRRGASADAWIIADVDKITSCGRDRQGEDQGQTRSHIKEDSDRRPMSPHLPFHPAAIRYFQERGIPGFLAAGGLCAERGGSLLVVGLRHPADHAVAACSRTPP